MFGHMRTLLVNAKCIFQYLCHQQTHARQGKVRSRKRGAGSGHGITNRPKRSISYGYKTHKKYLLHVHYYKKVLCSQSNDLDCNTSAQKALRESSHRIRGRPRDRWGAYPWAQSYIGKLLRFTTRFIHELSLAWAIWHANLHFALWMHSSHDWIGKISIARVILAFMRIMVSTIHNQLDAIPQFYGSSCAAIRKML